MSETAEIKNALRAIAELVSKPQYRTPTMDFYLPSGGQIQLSVAGPRYRGVERDDPTDPGMAWPEKLGAVFVEAAPPDKEKDGFLDWRNKKITFAMSDKDIGQVIAYFRGEDERLSVVHAPENDRSQSKTLSVRRGMFKEKPQWEMRLVEKRGTDEIAVKVFLTTADVTRLCLFLESALPYIFGFNKL